MKVDRRTLLIAPLAVGFAAQADALPLVGTEPDAVIELWPSGAPGMAASPPPEEVHERSTDAAYNDRSLVHIRRPRLSVFRPARPNGAAVMLIPGGAYERVVIDKEGYETARWLAERGITAFVLFYRLPGDGWVSGADTGLADAQRAMRLIRGDRHVDAGRVCAMGFSAGGHVCGELLTKFDRPVYAPVDAADRRSARPDAAAPIYPVVSMRLPEAHAGSRAQLLGRAPTPAQERTYSTDLNARPDAPPCFLLHAEDDATVAVANSLLLRDALRARGVATETHLFPDGGHGFGLGLARGKSVEHWPDLFFAWGRYRGLWS